jgi:hypothetical protein
MKLVENKNVWVLFDADLIPLSAYSTEEKARNAQDEHCRLYHDTFGIREIPFIA